MSLTERASWFLRFSGTPWFWGSISMVYCFEVWLVFSQQNIYIYLYIWKRKWRQKPTSQSEPQNHQKQEFYKMFRRRFFSLKAVNKTQFPFWWKTYSPSISSHVLGWNSWFLYPRKGNPDGSFFDRLLLAFEPPNHHSKSSLISLQSSKRTTLGRESVGKTNRDKKGKRNFFRSFSEASTTGPRF